MKRKQYETPMSETASLFAGQLMETIINISGNGPGYSGGGHGGGQAKELDEDEEALEERPEAKVEYGSLR